MPGQYQVDLEYRLAGPYGRTPDTAPQAQDFLSKLYPATGVSVFDDRQNRLANLLAVRPSTAFRRPPGTTPYVCGPVT